jgi:predicted DNA-binding protein
MNILIRDLPPETVHRLDVLAAVAGLTRAELIRQLLEREGARLAMEQNGTAVYISALT